MVDFSLLQTPNILGTALTMYQHGRDQAMENRKLNALATYGTDPAGAKNALIQSGDVQTAGQLQGYENNQDNQQYAHEQHAAQVAALGRQSAFRDALQKGDLDAAHKLAAGDGDLTKVLDGIEQHAGQVHQVLAAAASSLKSTPDVNERRALIARMKPQLVAQGIPEQMIDGFDPTDQNIDAEINSSLSLQQQFERNKGVSVAKGADLVNPSTGAMLHHTEDTPPRPVSVAPGAHLVDPTTNQEVYSAPDRPQFHTLGRGATLVQTGGPEGGASPAGAPHVVAHGAPMPAAGGAAPAHDGSVMGFTPDTIDALAARYNAGDKTVLTGLGVGKQSVVLKASILNKATALAAQANMSPRDVLANRGDLQAATSALSNLTKLRTTVESFEQTASKNADLALQLSAKGGGQSGIPVLNRWVQAGRKNIAGDPDVASFNLALGTLTDEYAKVVTGGGGNQAVTDNARIEASRRIDAASSPAQLKAVISTMKQEMANRLSSMKGEEGQLRSNLSGRQPAAAASAPAAGQRLSPQEAAKLAPGTKFIGTDGIARVRH